VKASGADPILRALGLRRPLLRAFSARTSQISACIADDLP